MVARVDFVAGILDRAGAHPAPDQYDIFVRRVVESVPAAARRIDHVALDRGFLAEFAVDVAAAFEHDEELVAIAMQMALVTRTGFEHGPAHHLVDPCTLLV